MIRFYWLEPGILAGCSRPGARPGRHTAGDEEVAADLAELRRQGIDALLSLTESPLPAETLARHGHDLDILHLPVPDFHPPSPEQLGWRCGSSTSTAAGDRPSPSTASPARAGPAAC
jgi:hypothetical protein